MVMVVHEFVEHEENCEKGDEEKGRQRTGAFEVEDDEGAEKASEQELQREMEPVAGQMFSEGDSLQEGRAFRRESERCIGSESLCFSMESAGAGLFAAEKQ